MRRNHRIPSATGFRGSDWLRLTSMLTMLALLVMLMVRMRDPAMWKWMGLHDSDDDGAVASQQASAAPPAEAGNGGEAESPAAAPEAPSQIVETAKGDGEARPAETASDDEVGTDRDPDELEAFREEVQAVDDRSLYIRREEMEVYDRLVRWTATQSFAAMRQRARGNLKFNDFMQTPEEFRGKLVRMKLNVWRIQKCEKKTRDGYQVYEIWGSTDQSGAWLYDVIVLDLPEQMPVADRVAEQAYFAGYFLKLQGYQPALAAPNARPLYAPLLIGRIERVPPPTPELHDTDWMWAGIAGGALTLFIAGQFGWMFLRGRRRRSRLTPLEVHAARPGPVPIEEWFEGVGKDEEPEGNNSPAPCDLADRGPGGNGQGCSTSEQFRGGLDVDRPRNE